jgi:hypothetical protein
MRYVTSFLLCLFGSAGAVAAAENQSAISTTLGSTARYEIVQSELAVRYTFRVDRVCGNVSQLVQTADDDLTWQIVEVVGKPACAADGRARYQLFSSGLAARNTFLMNTDTGATWQMVRDGDDQLLFQKFAA